MSTIDEPMYSACTVRKLCSDLASNRINLNPTYQRAPAWTMKNKQDFIKNFFEFNFYVPPILLCQSDGESAWNVIDGKQRILTIVDFINNKFKNVHGKVFKALDASVQENMLDNDRLWTVTYDPLTIKTQVQIFQSLQKGSSLKPNDKIQAMSELSPILSHLNNHVNSIMIERNTERRLRILAIMICGILNNGVFNVSHQVVEAQIAKWDERIKEDNSILPNILQVLTELEEMKTGRKKEIYGILNDLDIIGLGYSIHMQMKSLNNSKRMSNDELVDHAFNISMNNRTRQQTNVNISNIKTIIDHWITTVL